MKKVFVAGLPYETTQEELAALIKPYGRVMEAKIIFDRETGRSKGFGFVEMSSEDEARAVIRQLDGRYVGTRKLFVNEYKPSPKAALEAAAAREAAGSAPAAPAAPRPGPPGGVERRSGQDRRKNPGFGSPMGERREGKPWGKERKPGGFGDKKPWAKKPWDRDRKPGGFGDKKPWAKKPWDKDRKPGGFKKPWAKKPGAFRKPRREPGA